MDNLLINYSSDPKINFNRLQSGEEGNYFLQDKVKKMIEEHFIKGILSQEESWHRKLSLIKPQLSMIYYMGNISLLDKKILSIVGPRKNTQYADKVLQKLFENLKNYDIATISGLADGVDQLCHSYSIQNHIPTIAVLGTGIGRYLQSSHRDRIQKIIDSGGLILSEYKLFGGPAKYTFPHRNRIIAGLCDVLFLPEAGEDSGSLITVDFANKMHKPVYGVPNDIFSDSSRGLNKYISEKKIQLVSDFGFLSKHFLSQFLTSDSGLEITNTQIPNISLSEEEKKILNLFSEKTEIGLDEMCSLSLLPYQELFSLLTILEIKNIIYQSSPGIYKTI